MLRRRWHQVRLCVSCFMVGAMLSLVTPARGQALTAAEMQALDRGELVTRESVSRRGRFEFIGGTSYQVIDASLQRVWRALLDTPSYSQMLPQVTAAELVSEASSTRVVLVRQGNGLLEVTNYLELKVDKEAHEIGFRLSKSHNNALRAAYGLYSLRRFAGGRTLLVYAVMADIGSGLLNSLVRSTVHEWMLKVPWTIRLFVERKERDRRAMAASTGPPPP